MECPRGNVLGLRILEDIFKVLKALALASAPSPWPWPCAERSSKFSKSCIGKGRTNVVKNFSKVRKLGDNLL